jgi:hypothetical protein
MHLGQVVLGFAFLAAATVWADTTRTVAVSAARQAGDIPYSQEMFPLMGMGASTRDLPASLPRLEDSPAAIPYRIGLTGVLPLEASPTGMPFRDSFLAPVPSAVSTSLMGGTRFGASLEAKPPPLVLQGLLVGISVLAITQGRLAPQTRKSNLDSW